MANMKLPYKVDQLTNFLKIKNWSHKPVQALLQHTIAYEEQLFGIYSFQFLLLQKENKMSKKDEEFSNALLEI